jgi:hypothetical protein
VKCVCSCIISYNEPIRCTNSQNLFGMNLECSILILLTSHQQTCMTYTIAVCTVENSWWWTEELSKMCRVLFQNKILRNSASSWLYYKKFITMHGHMNVKIVILVNNNLRNNKWTIIQHLFWGKWFVAKCKFCPTCEWFLFISTHCLFYNLP